MYSVIVVLGVTAMLASLSAVDGHFTKIDDMTETELVNWVKPPNKQTVQRMLLDRILKVMDPRYNPCDDFYKFSCGNYAPLATAGYEAPNLFTETIEQTLRVLELMLTRPGRGYSSSRVERKVRDFFDSCMNGQRRLPSMQELMESYGSWPALDPYWRESDFDWMKTVADIAHYDGKFFFDLDYAFSDNGRNQIEILSLLVNVSLQESEPPKNVSIFVEVFQDLDVQIPPQYIEGMARRMHAFKSELYKITDAALKYFRNSVRGRPIYDIQRQVPSCDIGRLVALITGQEVDTSKSVGVPSVQYLEDICRLMRNTDKKTIADYLFFILYNHVSHDLQTYKLTKPEGITKFCVRQTHEYAGQMLGKLYIDEYLTPEVMGELSNMTDTLHDFAVEMMRTQTSWLDERTRYHAVKKMEAAIKILVAPEYGRSEEKLAERYRDVSIDPRNYMDNLKQLRKQQILNKFGVHGKLRQFFDIKTLELNPVFAGDARGFMLIQAIAHQLPLFHNYAPSFYKFGTMMAILGHEFMHGFDVANIIYDENGQEQEWMSPNIKLSHSYRSQCFVRKFDEYKVENTDVHIGGNLTLNENVADNDGLKIAFRLYKKWMAENPDIVKQEEIEYAPLHLTHEQLFFLSYGQTWCETRSLESLIHQIQTDVHSPNIFRVLGGVSNSHEFARAYQCPPHFKMNPPEKCSYIFD